MLECLINVHDTQTYILFDYTYLLVQLHCPSRPQLPSRSLHHPILIVHLVSQRAVISAVCMSFGKFTEILLIQGFHKPDLQNFNNI